MTSDSETSKQPLGLGEISAILRGTSPREGSALIWLTVLMLLQSGLLAWVYWPRAGAESQPAPILGDMSVDQVAGLSITDQEGEQIQLLKNGDQWWVLLNAGGEEEPATPSQCSEEESRSCYPAVNHRVETFLNALADLNTSRLVARSESSRSRLRVAADSFVHRVQIEQADGGSSTLYVGTSPHFSATHVRAAANTDIYLSDSLSSADADTAVYNWIDTIYFQATEAEIRSLEIANANGALTFTRDETGQWQMDGLNDGEAFNAGALFAILPSVTNLNMVEPLGATQLPAYGIDRPNAVLTLVSDTDGENSLTRTLTIGAKDEEGSGYVVKSSESPYYVLASGFNVGRLVESARADFLAADDPLPTQAAEGQEP